MPRPNVRAFALPLLFVLALAFLPHPPASATGDVDDAAFDVLRPPLPGAPGPFPRPSCERGPAQPPPLRWDYGDAPEHLLDFDMWAYTRASGSPVEAHFPVREASYHALTAGARHRMTNVAWLGSHVSLERDVASGYDQDFSNNYVGSVPDQDRHDDGLAPLALIAGTTASLRFSVTTYGGVNGWYVNALVDWNLDGRWGHPTTPEWVVRNKPITVAAMTTGIFTAPVTAGATIGTPWVRLTLSDTPILYNPNDDLGFSYGEWSGAMPLGTADHFGAPAFRCGETEDYCGAVTVVYDRSAAPVSGPTPPRSSWRCPTGHVGKGVAGLGKTFCEPPADWRVHVYGPPAVGAVGPAQDGNLEDCDGDGAAPDFDRHSEYAEGGAWLLSTTGDGLTSGSLACHAEEGHHPAGGFVGVADDVFADGVAFTVSADASRPEALPQGPDCGDGVVEPCDAAPPTPSSLPSPANAVVDTVNALLYDLTGPWGPLGCNQDDRRIDCIGSCLVPFAPGVDGAYLVTVLTVPSGATGLPSGGTRGTVFL